MSNDSGKINMIQESMSIFFWIQPSLMPRWLMLCSWQLLGPQIWSFSLHVKPSCFVGTWEFKVDAVLR